MSFLLFLIHPKLFHVSSQSLSSSDLRVCLPKDEHGAVGKDLSRPISGRRLLQIFLLLIELEVVNVVH